VCARAAGQPYEASILVVSQPVYRHGRVSAKVGDHIHFDVESVFALTLD